jgi:hypothetical protein
MRTSRHYSPLPPDPITSASFSPLPPDPITSASYSARPSPTPSEAGTAEGSRGRRWGRSVRLADPPNTSVPQGHRQAGTRDRQGASEDLYCRGGAAVRGPSRHRCGSGTARALRRRRARTIVGLRDRGSRDSRAQSAGSGLLRSGNEPGLPRPWLRRSQAGTLFASRARLGSADEAIVINQGRAHRW